MQSAKSDHKYKFQQFEVSLIPQTAKKVGIMVVDPFSRTEFKEQTLELKQIGTTTLMKALQQDRTEIKMSMEVIKTDANTILRIDVLVASQFLKPVEETIFINKTKDISQSQLLKQSVDRLSKRLSELKVQNADKGDIVLCGDKFLELKEYSGAGYQPIGSLKLKPGKYMITISFLIKAHSTWIYIYQGNGTQFMANGGFYVPNGTTFVPIVLNKYYSCSNEQNYVVNTNAASSYRFALKNTVISAHRLSE